MIAASMTAAFSAVADRLEEEHGEAQMTPERAKALIEEVLEFLRGGLDGLRGQS